MFIPVLFTITKIWKQPKCPSADWFKKMCCVCVCVCVCVHICFPSDGAVKNPLANAGNASDAGSTPGLGRSPEVGNDNLL